MVAVLAASFGNLKFSYSLATARRALRIGDPALAVMLLEKQAERGAESADWQRLLIRSLRRSGRMDEAKKQLDAAKQVITDDTEIRQEELLLQARQGEVKKLEPQLVALLVSGVSDDTAEDIYEAMAQGYWAAYHVNDTLRCLQFWGEWQKDNLAPRLWMAEVYRRSERSDEAIAEYRRILEFDPNHAEALAGAGQLLLKKLEIAEAAEMFVRCLATSPESIDALFGLAECRRRQGANEEVKDLLYDVLTLNLTPEQASRATGTLGTMALEDRDYVEAIRLLQESISLDSDDVATHLSLAAALAATGQDEMAAVERRRGGEVNDRHTRIAVTLRKVLENPENADLRCEAGLIYIESEKWHLGADWILSALQLNPRHRAAHEALAKYYEHIGDREQAKRHRESAGQAEEAAESQSENG